MNIGPIKCIWLQLSNQKGSELKKKAAGVVDIELLSFCLRTEL